jgi:HTH-type transcriptional regulator, sugar sensing transcriptional regulator
MIESVLEEIGLTKGEIKVYLALLELGSTTTGKIIEKSGISGSKSYEVLERLMKKGLASFIVKGETKYFEASEPKRILDFLEEKELSIKKQKDKAKTLIKELELKKSFSKYESEVTVFKGIKGLKTAYLRSKEDIEKGETVFGMMPQINEPLLKFFPEYISSLSKEKKVKNLGLFFEHSTEMDMIKNIPGVEVKVVPQQYKTPAEIAIHHNNVIISTSAGKEYITILIKNKDIADSFKAQFNFLWNQKVRTFYGKEGAVRALKEITVACKKGLTSYGFGTDVDHYVQYMQPEFNEYVEEAKKYKFKTKLIFAERFKSPNITAEIKYLPKEYFPPVRTMIYGNKVAIVDFTNPITTIIIEKKEIADSYKKHFELLWKIAKK